MKKINYIVLVAGALVMLLGYYLMAGSGSDENQFNPEIFSDMRIKVAPIVCVLGFLVMGAGIMIRTKKAE
ncbi:MAG: DUF3098 domain-containing protein [Bacteroidaceae bacterium]|nr:DUF3098 domain-containing protein [Bacteroidaceae bacterium]